LPLYKELVDSYKVQYIAGGATQNAIRVAQWMFQTPGVSQLKPKEEKKRRGSFLLLSPPPFSLPALTPPSLSPSLPPRQSTSFFGCIGQDAFGAELQKCAEEDGVNAYYKEDTEAPTGTCAVLVKDGERSLCANLGAANKFTAEHLASVKAKEMIAEAQMFYVASFFLTVSVESLLEVANHAVEHNKV